MRPPLIVTGDGEALVFDSNQDINEHLEWIDVEDRVYRAWDSDGLELDLYVDRQRKKRRWGWGYSTVEVIGVREDPFRSSEPEKLQEYLTQYLLSAGEPADELKSLALPGLIARAKQRFGPS